MRSRPGERDLKLRENCTLVVGNSWERVKAGFFLGGQVDREGNGFGDSDRDDAGDLRILHPEILEFDNRAP